MVSLLRTRKAATFLLIMISLLLGGAAYASEAAGDLMFSGALREWLLTLLASGMLFLLPGWALLRLWEGAARLTLTEQAALATGVGMALYPVLMLLTGIVGLNLGPLYAWLPPLAALPLLLWSYQRRGGGAALDGWRAGVGGEIWWQRAALLLVLAMVVGVRCVAVAGLEVPLWGELGAPRDDRAAADRPRRPLSLVGALRRDAELHIPLRLS